jgi:dephospho-CoA kinase
LADDVLDNGGELDDLARRVRALHDRYLQLAKTRRDSLPEAG